MKFYLIGILSIIFIILSFSAQMSFTSLNKINKLEKELDSLQLDYDSLKASYYMSIE